MVSVVGKGHGMLSSNPARSYLYFTFRYKPLKNVEIRLFSLQL